MEKLRIHYFQHVAFEGLGSIEDWIIESGHSVSCTRFFLNETPPDLSEIDWLIIMGGPMNVNDEDHFPWMVDEKKYIRQAIQDDKTVLGICLGSQLISRSLVARVYQNGLKEIGWFDIELTSFGKADSLFSGLGDKITVFQWHGDTFDLPYKAVHLASSPACINQAYRYNKKVVALQFHLETTEQSLRNMIDNCRSDITPGKYVQTEEEITSPKGLFQSNREVLFTLLNRLAAEE
jgi:GMP synthase-like glutamine amidotransferase